MEKVVLSDAEWRERLAPEEYKVLRQAGTEAPWTGEYTDTCDSHLGHVFEGEGYDVPTDQRWCINSVSLTLEPAE